LPRGLENRLVPTVNKNKENRAQAEEQPDHGQDKDLFQRKPAAENHRSVG
jgi:hypothetical protein